MTPTQLIVAGVVVLIGALVQGGVGFGLGLVAVPVLMFLVPDRMPATMIILGSVLPLISLAKEWRHVDVPGLGWGLVGRLPGSALGALVVAVAPPRVLGLIIGLLVLVAALAQWRSWRIRKTPASLLLAGSVSGLMGTASGVGGPPVAMVYAGENGPTVRATLGGYFLVGTLISLGALAITGRVSGADAQAALTLLPFLVAGALLSGRLARLLDGGWTRAAILIVAALSGAVLAISNALPR